eukprot:393919_1
MSLRQTGFAASNMNWLHFFAGDKIADRQFKPQDVPLPMGTYNKLVSQEDYHFQKETNCKQQVSIAKSDATLEGAAMLTARRSMKKEVMERLHSQARQSN